MRGGGRSFADFFYIRQPIIGAGHRQTMKWSAQTCREADVPELGENSRLGSEAHLARPYIDNDPSRMATISIDPEGWRVSHVRYTKGSIYEQNYQEHF